MTARGHKAATERIASRRAALLVCLALLALTAATVALAQINLGGWNTIVALAIATGKAVLIGSFFMEARYSRGLIRLVALVALFWFSLLLAGTLDDVLTRGWLAVPGK